jgi:hypothetical protein
VARQRRRASPWRWRAALRAARRRRIALAPFAKRPDPCEAVLSESDEEVHQKDGPKID